MTVVDYVVPGQNKIRDYVEFCGKPFTVNDIMDATGVGYKSAANYIIELEKKGIVKAIHKQGHKKVYVRTKKKASQDRIITTREEILIQLRKGAMTINELHRKTKRDKNVIRKHLFILIDEGKVERRKRDYREYEYKLITNDEIRKTNSETLRKLSSRVSS